jgi:phosphoribosylaminoimidazole carboxylase PurE protein
MIYYDAIDFYYVLFYPLTMSVEVEQSVVPEKKPLVGIIIGSKSDWPKVRPAAEILEHFEIPFEVGIRSAHRLPDKMSEYGRTARSRGLKVILAAAGGSAHLPGMTASETNLPLVGIPIEGSREGSGQAAMDSMIFMPPKIPLGTMGLNDAINSALYAVRILGAFDDELAERYDLYVAQMRREVLSDHQELQAQVKEDFKFFTGTYS